MCSTFFGIIWRYLLEPLSSFYGNKPWEQRNRFTPGNMYYPFLFYTSLLTVFLLFFCLFCLAWSSYINRGVKGRGGDCKWSLPPDWGKKGGNEKEKLFYFDIGQTNRREGGGYLSILCFAPASPTNFFLHTCCCFPIRSWFKLVISLLQVLN